MEEDRIVSGKTSSGIEFKIDRRIREDARFLYYLTKAQDENSGVNEKSKAIVGLLGIVFGPDEGVINFMNAVASVHEGVCSVENMLSELMEIFNALDVKN